MSSRIKVFIVDDHPIFRAGLCKIIEGDESLEVIGEASCGATALQKLEEGLSPDVAVVDIDMPGMTGLQLSKHLQKRGQSPLRI